MIRTIAIFATIFVLSMNVRAQEMWGISNSNFSGNAGIFLNPSTIVAAPYKYEVNILTVNIFAQNNFFYSPADDQVMVRAIKGDSLKNAKVYMNMNNSSQSGFAKVFVMGPSIVYNHGNNAFGFHTALRHEAGVINVPAFLTNSSFQKYSYATYHDLELNMPHVSSAAMTWAETGFTYGRICLKKEKDFLKMAVTANILTGFNGAYVDIRQFDYRRPDTNLLSVDNIDASFGHAIGSTNGRNMSPFSLQGIGYGTTIGFTYVHNRKQMAYGCTSQADKLRKYEYRIGASLIDIGKIHFDSKDATEVNVKSSTPVVWNNINSVKITSLQSLDTTIANNLGGTVNKQGFNIWLPMAFSAQFDYSITPHVYANLTFLNRLHFFGNQIARPNQTNLSLRYERRTFETSINFTLFEYSQPSMGAAIRYGFFFFGTDRLLEAVSYADLKSINAFFGVKMNFCDVVKKKNTSGCPPFKS